MRFDYQRRMQQLLDDTGLDAVALIPGANMVYFTGLHFHRSERPIIAFVTRDGLSVIIPQLEVTKLQKRDDLASHAFEWSDTESYQGAFEAAFAALGGQRIGVDGQAMRVFEWLALGNVGFELSTIADVGRALLQIRAIKTQIEIDAMQEAVRISEEALRRVMDWVKPGMTEKAVASRLSDELAALGSGGHAFSPIVLSGTKSALPHGNTSDDEIKADDFLLIDFGGTHNEYPADITRTFCLGTPSDEMRRIYDAVYQANAAARAIAKPGVTCGEVDKAARDAIEAAGYGKYFTHRTGHGLGLEGHELPQIAANVDDVLQVGMVFTIEPGVYVPEIGGVRIEDDVVVTEDAIQSLTSYPRELE